jgi:hypothetical protein
MWTCGQEDILLLFYNCLREGLGRLFLLFPNFISVTASVIFLLLARYSYVRTTTCKRWHAEA